MVLGIARNGCQLPVDTQRSFLCMISLRLLYFVLLFVVVAPRSRAVEGVTSAEWSALIKLRYSLGIRGSDWPIKAKPCIGWKGIECENGKVVGINISGFRRTRTGSLNPSFNVDSLVNFTSLQSFNASRFLLYGSIPDWFGSRLSSLRILDLRSCSLTGSVPPSLGSLVNLRALYLSDNALYGTLPATLGKLTNLAELDVSSNAITGLIPDKLTLLRNLTSLDLSSNSLSGPISPKFGSLPRLRHLNLSDNQLSESIPLSFGNLTSLVNIDLSKNFLSGSLPVELKGLINLQQLVAADNKLDGRLAGDLFSNLRALRVVELRRNKLNGELPTGLWSLPKLLVVDLSFNNFTGDLPRFNLTMKGAGSSLNLSNNAFYGSLSSPLTGFEHVDISANYMQGTVYWHSNTTVLNSNCLQKEPQQKSLSECTLFYTERGLIFDNFELHQPRKSSNKIKRWIYIVAGVIGGIGFFGICGLVLVLCIRKRHKIFARQKGSSNVGPVPEGDNQSSPKDLEALPGLGHPFTYGQLASITDDFHERYVLKHGHTGDIFQANVGGSPIVVKRVNSRCVKRESFLIELELLSKHSHFRLVPLLGHCMSNENGRFFIYKYMGNGDLANSLHKKVNMEADGLRSLDWITRLKIAIGAAEGVCYLHHGCNPPLVHRDIQASSILLDDKFEVRLGSLSGVCVQEGEGQYGMFSRFLRKSKSSDAGASGLSSATCAYDVYCFGKVLMELVSGKLGISSSDDTATREWLEQTLAHVDIYDKEPMSKIVDPSLILDDDLSDEVWAMSIIAKSCLNAKPSKRPLMRHVLKALENPLKIVRGESCSSRRLKTTSSRRSWSAAVFGSRRNSTSEGNLNAGPNSREGTNSFKMSSKESCESGKLVLPSSFKGPSMEILPFSAPLDTCCQRDD